MSENKIKSEKHEVGYKSDSMDIEGQEENIFNSEGNLNLNENNEMILDTEEISDQDCWKVISAYFFQHGLVSQQIDSFNQFVSKNIQEIIDENKTVKIESDPNYKKKGEQITYELNFNKLKKIENPKFMESNSNKNKSRKIFPNEARVRNLDYISDLKVDVTFREKKIKNGKETKNEETKTHFIGKIPIMVRSNYCSLHGKTDIERVDLKECEFDQGGYFIINGSEKVIVAQERMATNFVYVFNKKEQSGFTWQAEIRSSFDSSNQSPVLFTVKITKKNTHKCQNLGERIMAKVPYVKSDIDIVILFRALGLESDKDIIDYIIFDEKDNSFKELLRPSLEYISSKYKTKDECLEYIGKRSTKGEGIKKEDRIERGKDILAQYLLPHISTKGDNESKKAKAYFIGYMIYRLGNCVLGRACNDDRDHFGKKRLDVSGVLLTGLFRHLFTKFVKNAEKNLKNKINNKKPFNLDSDIFDTKKITDGMRFALATGNWVKNSFGVVVKTGVSQTLQRLTFISSLSHLRRVNNPLEKTGKITKPRQLHNTHWGMLCPAETPEGQECGLVKNLSLMAFISFGTSSRLIQNDLDSFSDFQSLSKVIKETPESIRGKSKIFINGSWIGVTNSSEKITEYLKNQRKRGKISKEISIVNNYMNKEIRIYTDSGRCLRPLFIVEKYKNEKNEINSRLKITKQNIKDLFDKKKTFDYLVANGIIEYLDVEEEEYSMIAMKPDDLIANKKYCSTYTHCEIHPAMILGVSASIIPFPDHNQSPRNVYQSAMGKQAIGIYNTNFNIRMDTLSHLLFYPQKPLVTTQSMEFLKFKELPAGTNAIVAIMCYTGYNQEDSIIMNQSSIDRGLFRSAFFRTYKSELRFIDEKFEIPDKRKVAKCGKLGEEGIIFPGKKVKGGEIIIGKIGTTKIRKKDDDDDNNDNNNIINSKTRKDLSEAIRPSEEGIIESVMLSTTQSGYPICKVKCRSIRIPQIGDKFASRHGQKGTIGMTYLQEDMPFNIEGITPDIIINPHAIPSRMTIGHLIECLSSKSSALHGLEGEATPFSDISVDTIAENLHKLGYQKYGNEAIFNGFTGRKFDILIFFGPTYYQKLKHMVADKIFSRATGPVQILTRQPTEGKARNGGLRIGEMEKDCMISHGAAIFLKERLMDVSDKYTVHVCKTCGLFAIAGVDSQSFRCQLCKNNSDGIVQVNIPYACKLLFQELMAMHIVPRIIFKNK